VIQHDVLVCEQFDRRHDSLQTYIAAVGRCFVWRIRTPNTFCLSLFYFLLYIEPLRYVFLTSRSSVVEFLLYI